MRKSSLGRFKREGRGLMGGSSKMVTSSSSTSTTASTTSTATRSSSTTSTTSSAGTDSGKSRNASATPSGSANSTRATSPDIPNLEGAGQQQHQHHQHHHHHQAAGSTASTSATSTITQATPATITTSTTNAAIDDDDDNAVAIVGMSCRTAGDITTPEQLWRFLIDKRDAAGSVPLWRWEPWLRRDGRNKKEIDKTVQKGYFIEKLENFDAAFFGISPLEAEQMDPQTRMGLELAWEALEHAGIDPRTLAGSSTACYVGIDARDYSHLVLEDLPNIDAHMGIGTSQHGVPNRISYHLDLMGPSCAVDAACASSLIAAHLGRQAILNRESDVAIVGGVNVMLAPAFTRMLGKAGALSPDGFCRSFDDAANGYARGEGGAMVILKRLSHALADGDTVYAVLKGTATAADGKTNGIMAPNADAQAMVARRALAVAGVDPLTVGFVEAHATSTPLGDPTEMRALTAVYGSGAGRSLDAPVMVGSIKPNVGHLESGAGAIGLVKTVLSVHKGELAPQTRLQNLNRRVDWRGSALHVVRDPAPWREADGVPRRGAVCSYGYGGSVSHAVVEEFRRERFALEEGDEEVDEAVDGSPVMITISASQEKRLALQAKVLADWLESAGKDHDLKSVANTLAQRRAHHDYRAAFTVASHQDAIQALRKFAAGTQDDAESTIQGRVLGGSTDSGAARQAVWVFSGHGAQWDNMAKELLHHDAVFRAAVDSLDHIYKREAGFSLVDVLARGDFASSDRVQVVTYAMQIGLARVLRARGVEPRAVIGHSVGEIAAAVAAGCLTPEEGALVVIRRARLYAHVREKLGAGGMALVNLPFAEVKSELGSRRDLVAAIDSSPGTCVVSGEAGAVETYMDGLKVRGVKTFRVKTDIAFHSPVLDQLAAPLEGALNGSIKPRPASIPIYSTSCEADVRTREPRDTAYWVRNMIQPVHLRAAVNAAVDDGHRIFVEVSSHPIVLHSISETLACRDDVIPNINNVDEETATIPTLRRDTASAAWALQRTVAQLHVLGSRVDFAALLGHKRRWCRTVPPTPWVQRPFWKQVETGGPAGDDGGAVHDVEKHTLLGRRVGVAGTDTVVFTTRLDDKTKPYPLTHPLDGTDIVPAAVYVNTYHHATGATELSNIQLRIPVSMSSETRNVQVVVRGDQIEIASSAIPKTDSEDAPTWVSHSSCQRGHLNNATAEPLKPLDLDTIRARIGTKLPNNFSVDFLSKVGVQGIAFPWQVTEHHGNTKEMLARVDMDPSVDTLTWDPQSWGPILDAATSVGSTIFFNDPKMRIVSHIDRVTLHSPAPLPKTGYLHVEEAADAKSLASHVTVTDEAGTILARFRSMRFSDIEGASGASGSVDSLVHQMAWVPPRFSEKPRAFNQVVLVSPDTALLETYAERLAKPTTPSPQQVASPLIFKVRDAGEIVAKHPEALAALGRKGSAIIYVPGSVETVEGVPDAAEAFIWETTSLLKFVMSNGLADTCKLFVLTNRVFAGENATALAQGPLYGLGRIIAAEHPDVFGSVIDNEDIKVPPMLALKYVSDHDVVRIMDGLPRRALMRPLSRDPRRKTTTTEDNSSSEKALMPRPDGTYVITGGLGDLGLETARFLVEKGARRIVLLSRRSLPRRSRWGAEMADADSKLAPVLRYIQGLEKQGASIHAVALDIAAPDAADTLLDCLDALGLPPVRGVVHAAGVLEDGLVQDTSRDSFARVLAPKMRGALALHQAFPPDQGPNKLDFFILYSSLGQLLGAAGQGSYASGNAFLDALTSYRRARGDDGTVAFLWTAWRGLGMATTTDFLAAELEAKQITDISRDEGFRAWEHAARFREQVGEFVVTRCRVIDEGESVAMPILEDVVPRRPKSGASSAKAEEKDAEKKSGGDEVMPKSKPELEKWLSVRIRECIGAVLHITDIEDIDPRAAVSDLGVDSVMTVALRQKLQGAFKSVKVPPTLTWNHPTVNALVGWFMTKLSEE